MIELSRRTDGSPLRIGHRGAPALAPENTLRSFRAAVDAGVDLVEFDVLDLRRGPLVVAHSTHLTDITDGATSGSLRSLSLAELREVAPEIPTFDEALEFFADEATSVGVHIDLKLGTRLEELCGAIDRHGLGGRTVVSATHRPSLRAIGRWAPQVRTAFTYPHDRFGVSRRSRAWPAVALGLSAMRASVPPRLGRLVRSAEASAVMLQHRLVTPAVASRARALGLPLIAWTVDDAADLERVLAAGVDGVITNDPSIFAATLRT